MFKSFRNRFDSDDIATAALVAAVITTVLVFHIVITTFVNTQKTRIEVVTEVGSHLETWHQNAKPGEELEVKMGADTFNIGDIITVERPDYLHTKTTTFTADDPHSWCFEVVDTDRRKPYHYLPNSDTARQGTCP